MAIKFTDKTDDDKTDHDGKPKKPEPKPAKVAEATPKPTEAPAADSELPGIPPAKGGPRSRGRGKAFG